MLVVSRQTCNELSVPKPARNIASKQVNTIATSVDVVAVRNDCNAEYCRVNNGFGNQKRNIVFVKMDFQVLNFKF